MFSDRAFILCRADGAATFDAISMAMEPSFGAVALVSPLLAAICDGGNSAFYNGVLLYVMAMAVVPPFNAMAPTFFPFAAFDLCNDNGASICGDGANI
jgi:hypothetical protein